MPSLSGGPEPIEVYRDATARDASLPSPAVGQVALTLDDGAFYVYYGRFLGWRPPWTTAWGELAHVIDKTATSAFDTTEHEITHLRTTFTAVSGRKYRFTVVGQWSNGDIFNTAQGSVRIKAGGHQFGPVITDIETPHRVDTPVGSIATRGVFVSEGSFDSGDVTVYVSQRCDLAAGLGSGGDGLTGEPTTLNIDDVGPAAAPRIT